MCTWNSRDYCGKLLSFALTSWFANGVDPQNVSARVGVTVVLPCGFNITSVQIQYVRWYTDKEVVFRRWGKNSRQGEGYEGRVDVPEDELRKGNCSLVLKNVSVTDGGIYQSNLMTFIQSVELSVHETPKEPAVTGDTGTSSPHPLAMVVVLPFTLSCHW